MTPNFTLPEFVSPEIYSIWGESSANWVHCNAPEEIQKLRDHLGAHKGHEVFITINDWSWGGNYQYSGVRPPFCPEGAEYSMHKAGAAYDLKFKGCTVDEAYTHIIHNQNLYPHISRIEHLDATRSKFGTLGRDWLHLEFCKERKGAIYVFKP
jgi:hypothetical protein